jgi:hypothetical protein
LSAYLADTSRLHSHNAGHVVAAAHLTGREVLVLLACVAIACFLLWVPVLGDRLTATLSRNAPKAAPRIFFVGLGFLLAGLVFRVLALDVVGGGLIGLLLLGVLLDNY